MFSKIRLFLRQPFTETTSKNDLIKIMSSLNNYTKYPLDILPYKSVGESKDFNTVFEDTTHIKFTPENFRNFRLDNIRKSNSMLVIRNNMSESTAFELGYIYSKFPALPIFFAIDKKYPIKTTLLKDIHPNIIYYTYSKPEDITADLYNWLDTIAVSNNVLRKGGSHGYENAMSPLN